MMMASSSSSSSSSLALIWLYHVFLSFRGEDVRRGFLSHVLKEFKSKGIIVFIDNEIRRGESVGPVLVGAIRQSKVAVVLLSRSYASSSWCLDELVEIMKCREEYQQTVMTIFYEVDPSDVRKQTGDFGIAFEKTCVGKTEEVKQAWRQALSDVADIAGYHSSNCGNEADLINQVASDVMAVLCLTPSTDFDDFVGIRDRVTKLKWKLMLQSGHVKMIGIFGPGGIGKTTTARVLYNQLSPDFQFSTFLENIRGSFDKPCGNDHQLKLSLQKNLLCQIFNQGDIQVRHLRAAQEMLSDKMVLVVLDDVDNWWQLEEMAKQRGWVGPGSIIIITTEDRKLLNAFGLGTNQIYKMKYPTRDESLKIFCQYAFGQKFPDNGFESLAWEVSRLAGKLPLGLRVMGSYLRGMSRDEWRRALPWLRSTTPDREIESILRFSYDALRDNEKTLFLHIASFFAGFDVYRFKSYFAKSSLKVNHGLEVLAQKSLTSIETGSIRMHRLLQQMGREIVKKQCMENPGNPHFLTNTNEISDVLEEDTATGNVLGIMLRTSKKIVINKSTFQGRNSLQFLYFDSTTISTPEGLDCLPRKIVFLYWKMCPLRVWPSTFSGKFLVELIMAYSKFEMLWEGTKPLPCLKKLDFSFSMNLKKLPDLSEARSLEDLRLNKCKSLLELTSSIGNATKIYRLVVTECAKIKDFPNVCDSIEELVLCFTGIKEVPPWIENMRCLRKLIMFGCDNLETISPNISKLENLEFLGLSSNGYCSLNSHVSHHEYGDEDDYELDWFELFEAIIEWGPEFKRSWRLRSDFKVDDILPICLPEKALTSPISLRLRCSDIKTIPDCIRRLSGLVKLDVKECGRLVELPPLPDSLESLNAQGCASLKRIESAFQNPNICLNFAMCFNLEQKARELIQTSACKYAVLPGEEVPANFTHRACSSSLTIKLTSRPLPSSFRFKACFLLSKVYDNPRGKKGMYCSVRGKQNGLTVGVRSYELHMPALSFGRGEHLYMFEDSFSLNQASLEAEETTFTIVFRVNIKTWKVKGCGVRLLKAILNGKEIEDQECMGITVEASDESAGGEDDDDDDDDDDNDDGEEDEKNDGVEEDDDNDDEDEEDYNYGNEDDDDDDDGDGDDDDEDDSDDGGDEDDDSDDGEEDEEDDDDSDDDEDEEDNEDDDHVEDEKDGDGDNNKRQKLCA